MVVLKIPMLKQLGYTTALEKPDKGRYQKYVDLDAANAKPFQFWISKKTCFSTSPTPIE